jgi:hypothetical protein
VTAATGAPTAEFRFARSPRGDDPDESTTASPGDGFRDEAGVHHSGSPAPPVNAQTSQAILGSLSANVLAALHAGARSVGKARPPLRVLLAALAGPAREDPLARKWDAEMQEVLLSDAKYNGEASPEATREMFDMLRGSAVVTYLNYFAEGEGVAHSPAQVAELTCTFSKVVADRLFSLVLFSRADLLLERQAEVDLRVPAREAANARLRRLFSQRDLPTLDHVILASGAVPLSRPVPDPELMVDADLRLFPASMVLKGFVQVLVQELKGRWDFEEFIRLIPTWDEMEQVLRRFPLPCSEFTNTCAETKQFEVLTAEYTAGLTSYLNQRLKNLGGVGRVVLELGGDSVAEVLNFFCTSRRTCGDHHNRHPT